MWRNFMYVKECTYLFFVDINEELVLVFPLYNIPYRVSFM